MYILSNGCTIHPISIGNLCIMPKPDICGMDLVDMAPFWIVSAVAPRNCFCTCINNMVGWSLFSLQPPQHVYLHAPHLGEYCALIHA